MTNLPPNRNRLLYVCGIAAVLVFMGDYAKPISAAADPVKDQMASFDITGAYSVVGGQPTAAGQFKNGNAANEYPEGACIPVWIEADNTDNASRDHEITAIFDQFDNGKYGIVSFKSVQTGLPDLSKATNLKDFMFSSVDLNMITKFQIAGGGTVDALVSGPFSSANPNNTNSLSPTDEKGHYTIQLKQIPAKKKVNVLFCAQLHVDASLYKPGASMSVNLEGGSQNIAIKASQLLTLPKLTLKKIVASGSAAPDLWSFNISPAINGKTNYTIPAGAVEVVIDNIAPNGTYTITETGGPAGYTFQSGSGSNCTFSGSSASVTLAAAKPQQEATCVFTNAAVQPKLTLTKIVVNNDGGNKAVADFPLAIDGNPVTSGQQVSLSVGPHTVSETGDANYTGTIGGDCASDGTITLDAGQVKSCTITNDDIATTSTPPTTGTLTVIKQVVNNDGGKKTSSDFTINVSGVNPSQTSFAGSAAGTQVTLDPGSYSVDEAADAGYSKTLGVDCSGTIAAGESKTCTVTNDDIASFTATTGTVMVVKQVVNDNGGSKNPSDFTINITGVNPSQTSFPGSSAGTAVIMDAGAYSIDEITDPTYAKTLGADCSGTIAAGESKTCTITNDDIAQGGGGGFTATTGTLMVVKVVNNNDVGTSTVSDFPLFVDGNSVASGQANILTAGVHTVSETNKPNYQGIISGDCAADGTVNLAVGDVKTCRITNTYQTSSNATTTADIAVTKTADNANPKAGQTITYTIALTNIGPDAATNVQVTENLPAGLSYVSDTASKGSYSSTTQIWSVGAMAVGETQTLQLVTQSSASTLIGTSYTNTVIAAAQEYDPNHENNSASVMVTIAGPGGSGGGPVDPVTPPSTGGTGGVPGGWGVVTPSTPVTPATPAPQVLGTSDTSTAPTPAPAPTPRVLGETDEELPRTGLPLWALTLLALPAALVMKRSDN